MKKIIIGIQGGPGSFNEEAVMEYLKDEKITTYRIKYLYTSEKVLSELNKDKIDLGQFAILNSTAGFVAESLKAMKRHKFKVKKVFGIKITHALMVRPDANINDIDTIMTHPQVLAQCKNSLSKKYSHLKLTSGEGKLVDHSLVAQHLSLGKLPKNFATMGSKVLADIYNLKIIKDNLQDQKDNYTSFLVAERI